MSVKYARHPSSRTCRKKAAPVKKKTAQRQAWDSSVQDLTVHRATPEELAHRHEIHKSKNQWQAQYDLQEKLLMKKWRQQNGGTPDPLEGKRLALMMEILSDQYQMKDVLERSDRAMAVVKDLFGDAPRRRTGFPNVTMAPSCDLDTSRGVIVHRKDPPTRLSILSDSVMDSQALNEVEESETSDDEVEISVNFQPGLHTDRVYRILNEESLDLDPQHPANLFVTPRGAGHPPNGQIALNATAAVDNMKTRLNKEEQVPPEEQSSVIGRVLNPQPKIPRKLQTKGKKIRSSSSQRTEPSLSVASACELTSCSQSSLDVLNQMIKDVERELEAYERETGREVTSMPQAQGLTGFTLSLVSSIKRLVSYLKESDRQLRQEATERRRLKEELNEQRLLIDALTAEILCVKEGGSVSQLSHQSASEQPSSPSLPSRPAATKEPVTAPTGSVSTQVLSFMTELGLQDAEEEQKSPVEPPSGPHTSAEMGPIKHTMEALSVYNFQPAVMLSPPRQKTQKDFSRQSPLVMSSLGSPSSSPTNTTTSGKTNDSPVSGNGPSSADACFLAQRWTLPRDTQSSACPSMPQSFYASQGDAQPNKHHIVLQDSGSEDLSASYLSKDKIVAQMTELTNQNNLLKAQLTQLRFNSPLSAADKDRAVVLPGGSLQHSAVSVQSPMTLDMRIAELNRQSAEARDKLLSLIEQQKRNVVVSPAISPITPQREDSGGRERRIDAVVPMSRLADSSMEETPSAASRDSGRRSNTSLRSSVSLAGRASADGRRRKVEKEEGWFALSAHVS
ncbi:spindle and centriole-associated protein 1 isoform X1 [Mixophyes fleayi]|uniref:spindle and centriole-associated protein 1 isoform X1 n=1 Tax=Mixophyes fleayi TaxID=3061075 RepID=UPI003F4DB48F